MQEVIPTRVSAPVENNTMEEVFGKFGEMFKEFREDQTYEEYEEVKIYFDSNMLRLDDTTDMDLIVKEINRISSRLFMYGVVYESQQRVLQQLEDEFARWKADLYVGLEKSLTEESVGEDGKLKKKKKTMTETAKDNYIISMYNEEYGGFQTKMRNESYKVGLVKRVVGSLDSYSYKLHAILTHRQIALQKGL